MAVRSTNPGPIRKGDRVMVEMEVGQPPAEGQVVAESGDGKVTVAVFDATVEIERDRSRVWKDGFEIEEI